MNGIIVLPVNMNGKLENIQRINHKGENYIMDATTKTALLTPDPPDNFQIKNITLRVSKQRNNKYEIEPIYIQGILYPRKENM